MVKKDFAIFKNASCFCKDFLKNFVAATRAQTFGENAPALPPIGRLPKDLPRLGKAARRNLRKKSFGGISAGRGSKPIRGKADVRVKKKSRSEKRD